MKNKILFFVILFCITHSFFAQKAEIDVREQDLTEFPLVKGKLAVRNPDGIKTESVSFYENDKPVTINFQNSTKVAVVEKNKSILFLVLNTPNKKEMDWYKNVLKEAIKKGAIHQGDKIEILSFGCKVNDQLLFPSTITFTDNSDALIRKIDSITINKRPNVCSERSHIYLSISEALALYGDQNIKLPSAIFVLADDRALEPQYEGEKPGPRSKRLNIPIYSISYFKSKTYFDIKDLCKQTYGLYFCDSQNDVENSSNQLLKFLNDFNQRYLGVLYPFTYTSTFEKDGKTHSVKIDSKDGQTGFALLTPNMSFFEWIEANLILSIILFVVFVGIIIILILINKKNKLKKLELELKHTEQMSEMERHQQESEMKLSNQEMELNRINEEENRKREADLRAQNEQNQKEDDAQQLRKMLERGNLPWFEFRFENESGNCQIESPRFKVGRDTSNNWTINHPTVSRNHFILTFRDYKYTIQDVGSSYGLIVNGNKTMEQVLKHGDHIQVGDISLTFHI